MLAFSILAKFSTHLRVRNDLSCSNNLSSVHFPGHLYLGTGRVDGRGLEVSLSIQDCSVTAALPGYTATLDGNNSTRVKRNLLKVKHHLHDRSLYRIVFRPQPKLRFNLDGRISSRSGARKICMIRRERERSEAGGPGERYRRGKTKLRL